ncbi:MAG: hypothetical protein AAF988_07445 [Pseudomonadota bacterium]
MNFNTPKWQFRIHGCGSYTSNQLVVIPLKGSKQFRLNQIMKSNDQEQQFGGMGGFVEAMSYTFSPENAKRKAALSLSTYLRTKTAFWLNEAGRYRRLAMEAV